MAKESKESLGLVKKEDHKTLLQERAYSSPYLPRKALNKSQSMVTIINNSQS